LLDQENSNGRYGLLTGSAMMVHHGKAKKSGEGKPKRGNKKPAEAGLRRGR